MSLRLVKYLTLIEEILLYPWVEIQSQVSLRMELIFQELYLKEIF